MIYKHILILGLMFAYKAEGMQQPNTLKKLNASLETVLRERHSAIMDLAVLKSCQKLPVPPRKRQEWAEREVEAHKKILELADKEADLRGAINGSYSNL